MLPKQKPINKEETFFTLMIFKERKKLTAEGQEHQEAFSKNFVQTSQKSNPL